jgi:TRAP-type C4-dicarboxylate transport system substrate-binding protein
MLWPESVVQFKIVEVAPHMLQADIGSACSKTITMNADSWKRLPAEVREVIASVAIGYRDVMASNAVTEGQESVEAFKKGGGKITVLSREERAAWAKSMPNLAKEWIERLEPKGIPARQIVTAYMDSMRQNNQPIVRHWDRE